MSIVTDQSILQYTKDLCLTFPDYLFAAEIYVAFRSVQPNRGTMYKVKQELQQNRIDESQLMERRVDNCQQAQSSTLGRISAQRHRRREWEATLCYFRHSGQLNIFLVCYLLCQKQKMYVIDLYITHQFFPHFEAWNEDINYKVIMSEVDEMKCIYLLIYGLD